MDNLIEKILLTIQQLDYQIAIFTLIRHPVQARGGGKVAAPLGLQQPGGMMELLQKMVMSLLQAERQCHLQVRV